MVQSMIVCIKATKATVELGYESSVVLEGHRWLGTEAAEALARRVHAVTGTTIDHGGVFKPWSARLPRRFSSYAKLFQRHLCLLDELDDSWALDFHSVADEETNGFQRTQIGEFVYRAKYQVSDEDRDFLVQVMERLIRDHPHYAAATHIAAVPSSRRLPGLLAQELTRRLGKADGRLVRTRQVQIQKDVAADERAANQRNSMCSIELPDTSVIVVVDDLYETGTTMMEAARALRDAGAQRVLGLVATKTMRGTRGGGPW